MTEYKKLSATVQLFNCCFISTTVTEELCREKKYARRLIAGSGQERDLGSQERDGIGTELSGIGDGCLREWE